VWRAHGAGQNVLDAPWWDYQIVAVGVPTARRGFAHDWQDVRPRIQGGDRKTRHLPRCCIAKKPQRAATAKILVETRSQGRPLRNDATQRTNPNSRASRPARLG
jgi:hypothetical protein